MPHFFIPLIALGFACFTQHTREAGEPLPVITATHSQAKQVAQMATAWAPTLYPLGDLDADGQNDSAHLRCYNDTIPYTVLTFSGNLPKLRFDGYDGIIADVGDLDGNGTHEFIYNRIWFVGNRSSTFVYGYRNGQWIEFGEGAVWLDRMWNDNETDASTRYLQNCVKKIDDRHFYLNDLTFDADEGYLDTMIVHRIP